MKVLILTDFSKDAKNAAEFAIHSITSDAEFILANTHEEDNLDDFQLDTNEYKSKENLKKEVSRLKSFNSNLNISTVSSVGDPVDLAKRFEERGNADLIIMGTKGQTGNEDGVVGEVALKVSRETNMPVLCVPQNAKFTIIDKIALALEFEDFEVEKEFFAPLMILAKNFNSSLDIINVTNNTKEVQTDITIEEINNKLFDGLETRWHFINQDKDEGTIEKFCQENGIKILTVVATNRNFFQKLFFSSIPDELIKNASLPLLILEKE